jgi:hypothetical protein
MPLEVSETIHFVLELSIYELLRQGAIVGCQGEPCMQSPVLTEIPSRIPSYINLGVLLRGDSGYGISNIAISISTKIY